MGPRSTTLQHDDDMEVEFVEDPTLRRPSKMAMRKATLPTPPQTPTKPKMKRKKGSPGGTGASELTNFDTASWQDDDAASSFPTGGQDNAGLGNPGLGCDSQEHEPVFYEGIKEPHAKRKGESKSTHHYMEQWLQNNCETYLAAILEMEGTFADVCDVCNTGAVEIRCLDCISIPRLCRQCCRSSHRMNPFHRIEAWVHNRWQPSWLWQVGTVICLGHGTSVCPWYRQSRGDMEDMVVRLTAVDGKDSGESPIDEDAFNTFSADPTYGALPRTGQLGGGLMMTVVHTNGFHHLPVFSCFCQRDQGVDVQLLKAGLYPATSAETQTVFTIDLLKHYHLNVVDSHVSIERYCAILRRLSNHVFPSQSMERQRELARVWQQYDYLTNLKRNGFGVTSTRFEAPGKGSLALFCAVCPQPGVNLPEDWRQQEDSWRFWRFLTADGNFVLDHVIQPGPDQAIWLADGAGYFVERTRFSHFLAAATERTEASSCPLTCTQLRAIEDKNKGKRGYDSTGIVACACTRHGCFAPASVVDMQKGEKQTHGDYSLAQAYETTGASQTLGTRFAYDVNCQFCVRFWTRFQNDFLQSSIPQSATIVFLIGLFHVHGHKEECLARFAPTFVPGAGVVSGEILESLWSTLIGVAKSTRQMTSVFRVATLNACMLDSNIKKLLNMQASLNEGYAKAKAGRAAAEKDFALLNEKCSPEQRESWLAVMDDANRKRLSGDVKAMDVYSTTPYNIEGRGEVKVRLLRQERKDKTRRGVTDWLFSGIEIQEDQLELRAFVKRTASDRKVGAAVLEAERKRASLTDRIETFKQTGLALFDGLEMEEFKVDNAVERNLCICEDPSNDCNCVPELAPVDGKVQEVEAFAIPLPSTVAELPAVWAPLVEKEEALRVAQAHEALEALRGHIAHKSYLYRSNKKLANGKRGRKTVYPRVGSVESAMRLECKRYDQALWALRRLAVLYKHPELEELTSEDTKAVISIYDPNAAGRRDKALSWIWKVGLPSDQESYLSTADEYVQDLYRVNWIRACSRRDRWSEEVKMLESEMEWFVRFCEHQRDVATRRAAGGVTPGHSAYAHRQADMWYRLGRFARGQFKEKSGIVINGVLGPDVDDEDHKARLYASSSRQEAP